MKLSDQYFRLTRHGFPAVIARAFEAIQKRDIELASELLEYAKKHIQDLSVHTIGAADTDDIEDVILGSEPKVHAVLRKVQRACREQSTTNNRGLAVECFDEAISMLTNL